MRRSFVVLASLAFRCAIAAPQTHAPTVTVKATPSDTSPSTGTPTLSISTIRISANDLVWDPVSQRIYLSLPSSNGANGNAIQVLYPATGQLGANVPAGSEPGLLSVSCTSRYLYVGVDGASIVQRFTLPDLGNDIQIALGNSYFASDLQTSPVADGTVAVIRAMPGSPNTEGGVAIYDDGVIRPSRLCGSAGGCPVGLTGSFGSIQWNADASMMFSADNELTSADFYTIPVTSSGFGQPTDYFGLVPGYLAAIHFDRVTGYVYDDDGVIIDPKIGQQIGMFNDSGLMLPDGSLGKAFFFSQSQTDFENGTYTITSFDMQRFTPIAVATLSNLLGAPTHFVRWGANGIAFTTTGNAVYILSGSFVGSGGPAPSIANGGIAPVGSSVNTVQPGEWISIYGSNLASAAATWNGDFPISLGGVGVTLDGEDAYLSYVSPGQINLQVPDDTQTGPVSVAITTPAGVVTSTVTLAVVAPSIPLLDNKHVAAIIPRSDGSGAYDNGAYDVVGPTGTSLGYRTVAAKAGDLVELFAFGLGPTKPDVPAGQPYSSAAPRHQSGYCVDQRHQSNAELCWFVECRSISGELHGSYRPRLR